MLVCQIKKSFALTLRHQGGFVPADGFVTGYQLTPTYTNRLPFDFKVYEFSVANALNMHN